MFGFTGPLQADLLPDPNLVLLEEIQHDNFFVDHRNVQALVQLFNYIFNKVFHRLELLLMSFNQNLVMFSCLKIAIDNFLTVAS